MDIEIFTLCDAAAEYQGRLSILGVFDTIYAAQLPAVHPFCSVALRIRFDSIETGEHQLRLHILNEDGKSLIPDIEGTVRVEMPPNAGFATANLVLNLGQLKFDNYGEYEIKLAIDAAKVETLPFWLKETPKVKE